MRTPTDIVGQHIHLVKFDVTSSDGAANGFNYQDGSYGPDEVTNRIQAINSGGGIYTFDCLDQHTLLARATPFFGASRLRRSAVDRCPDHRAALVRRSVAR